MKKILLTVLSLVLMTSSVCFRTEAGNKAVLDKADVNESFIEVLNTEPDLLFEQYNNIIDIQTMTLSNKSRSTDGIEIEAYEYDKDGIKHFLETDATLTKVIYQDESAFGLFGDENTSCLYVLNANTKDTTDSLTKDGVTLNGCITWIDNFGMSNELVSVSGSRSGSYTALGMYTCKTRYASITSDTFEGASFENSDVGGEIGYQFYLIVKSPTSSGTEAQLIVKTSAFD